MSSVRQYNVYLRNLVLGILTHLIVRVSVRVSVAGIISTTTSSKHVNRKLHVNLSINIFRSYLLRLLVAGNKCRQESRH